MSSMGIVGLLKLVNFFISRHRFIVTKIKDLITPRVNYIRELRNYEGTGKEAYFTSHTKLPSIFKGFDETLIDPPNEISTNQE